MTMIDGLISPIGILLPHHLSLGPPWGKIPPSFRYWVPHWGPHGAPLGTQWGPISPMGAIIFSYPILKGKYPTQEIVGNVVDNQYQSANFEKVTRPREAHEQNGGGVMDEHHPKVLPLHVDKLSAQQAPVEGQLHHVPPPDVGVHVMIGVVVPAVSNVPQPSFAPQAVDPPSENRSVVQPPPAGLGELVQLARLGHLRPLAEPPFDTPFRHVQLL